MWIKREGPPGAAPASVDVPEFKEKATPVSSTPYRNPESDARNSATIGKAVKIVGRIIAKEDLYVDGDVKGAIESPENKVTIGPNGRVQASIRAREVIILGQVKGDVETDRVNVCKNALLVGDITTWRITIEDGALFKGSINITKPGRKASDAVPTPSPPVAQPVGSVPAAANVAMAAGVVKR
jgi:cytoskeletal protein CcmA (bactofilin family)